MSTTPSEVRRARGWSFLVWGLWFCAFVVLELLALRKRSPWITLSETGWSLERFSPWIRIVVFAGLAILLVHIVWGFPSNPLP